MNGFFKDTKTIEQMKEGLLGPYIVPYANQLLAEGYARQSGRIQLRLVADFGRWLARKGIAVNQLAVQHTLDFRRARKRAGYRSTNADQAALARLVRLLGEQAVITDGTPKPVLTASEVLLAEYGNGSRKVRRVAVQ